MKKIVCLLVAVVTILFSENINAQQRCGSMDVLQQQMQSDPNLALVRQQIENHTNQFLANPAGAARAVITIPVVVHVVYNTNAQNVSNTQIQAQIDRLNLDFRKLNTDWTRTPSVWQSLVADYEIEFCLATRDPSGNTTTGIVRKQTSSTSFSTNDNIKRTANGGDNAWPAASYLNIWVGNLSGGTLGYAQFPGGAAATDGVVINYTAFGTGGTAQSPYNLGRTATHEVGHWLNLYHIWGDDGSGCSGSDQVGDTPNQGAQHYGCPTGTQVSCSNGPNGDMYMNYMDYTDDACMYMFTTGQKTRSLSLFASGGSKVSLLSSLGCQAINTPPVANFSANVTSTCTGLVQFTSLSTNNPVSYSWNFGDGQTSTAQNPSHQYTTNGVYTVTLTATNTYGSNTKTLTSYITVNKPAAPTANNVSRCGAGTFTLTTGSTNPVAWLDSFGNRLSGATSYTTPVLTRTTTYYLQDTVPGSQFHVGKVNNSGSGGLFTATGNNWALVFNVNTACVLQSVYMYAGAAGNRTIELRTSGGTLLQTATVNLATGGNRVTLNFNLPVGTGYRISPSVNSMLDIYRNNAGATYPYNDAGGYVSITGNNASGAESYYYFFYDWIIQGPGCVSERRAVTATVSAGLNVTASTTSSTCGSSNGSATALVTGGTPAYTYTWNNSATGSSINNVVPGTYTVTVRDVNLCSGTATAVVSSQANLTSVKSSTNVTCNGGNNGTAGVTVSNGTPNYSYVWNNSRTTASVNSLTAGSYVVTITDGNNCVHVDSFTITQPTAIDVVVTANNARCNGEATGQASVVATGGNGNFSFNWSTTQTGNSIANLQAGSYTLTVSDAQNCKDTTAFVIDEPDAITTNTTTTAITCFGDNDGRANVVANGGSGNFSYLWCNNVTTHNTADLGAGVCSVIVTDDNGCTATDNVTIQQPAQITTTVLATAVTCFGSSNGSADITATGGTGNLAYEWCNSATTIQVSNLSAGACGVTVTDDNGCSAADSITIQQPAQIVATTSSTNATCSGANDGSASVTASGGTGNLGYLWCNGAATAAAANLGPGVCAVTITDGNGCTLTRSVTIQRTGQFATTVNLTNVTCFGGNNGSANVSVTGGTGSFTYMWCNGESAADVTNLSAGVCVVTVADGNNCIVTDSVIIQQPSQIVATANASDLTCFGSKDGSATVTATGGSGNLTYLWCNGDATASAANLNPGACAVTITDAVGCSISAGVTIQQPTQINTVVTAIDVTCFAGTNGSATVTATGGTGNLSYLWCNEAATVTASNLSPGPCAVTVTDDNGCTAIDNVTIAEPAQITVLVTANHVTCFGGTNGQADVTVMGGTTPYTYLWFNGDTTNTISNLSQGIFGVTVTDGNGCSTTATTTVQQPVQMVTAVSTTNNSVGIDTVYGGTAPFTYSWSTSDTTKSVGGLLPGSYLVTVTDANGCTIVSGANVTATATTALVQNLNFSMYPNPASEELMIKLDGRVDKTTLAIINMMGQTVLQINVTTQQSQINLAALNSGVYLVEVRQGDIKMMKNLVVSK